MFRLFSQSVFYSLFLPSSFIRKFSTSMETRCCVVESQLNSIRKETSEIFKLNKEKFSKVVTIPTVLISIDHISGITRSLKDLLLHIPRVKNVIETDNVSKKILLLNPEIFSNSSSISEDIKRRFESHSIDLSTWSTKEIQLTYDNMTLDDILKEILPPNIDGFGGFSNIGHIVHVNLKDTLLPFKYAIGQALLDKVSTAKTVVNKINVIDNKYRTFSMELLAGESNFVVECREHGAIYKFDFSKVYWNSRLATEHQRVVQQLKKSDVIYDVFAGVGPFAIPAAKKGCRVHANDLNPESCQWLRHNVHLNKVGNNVTVYELDGREFITTIVKADLESQWLGTSEYCGAIHIIMNLPALAVEFLDAFRGLLAPSVRDNMKWQAIPTVHCYCFSKCENPEEDARLAVEQALGSPLPHGHSVRRVRNVAPNKDMLCVTFPLPEDVLFAEPVNHTAGENNKCSLSTEDSCDVEPSAKKPKNDVNDD